MTFVTSSELIDMSYISLKSPSHCKQRQSNSITVTTVCHQTPWEVHLRAVLADLGRDQCSCGEMAQPP